MAFGMVLTVENLRKRREEDLLWIGIACVKLIEMVNNFLLHFDMVRDLWPWGL